MLSLVMWGVALFCPSYVTLLEDQTAQPTYGLELLFFGPLGGSEGHYAWFANPLWAWSLWSMARGRSPNLLICVAAVWLALPALQPFRVLIGDDHGVNGESKPLFGAYVWIAALVPPLLVSVIDFMRGSGRLLPAWLSARFRSLSTPRTRSSASGKSPGPRAPGPRSGA
jgi:hypothetical protein